MPGPKRKRFGYEREQRFFGVDGDRTLYIVCGDVLYRK